MDLHEAIEERRTVRKFKSPATEEQLQLILSAGVKAPSASNRQPWEFVVVDDPDLIKKIGQIKYNLNLGRMGGEAAAQAQKDSFAKGSLILVYYKEGPANAASAWACIQNMVLAAVPEGLGSRIAGFFNPDFAKEVDKLVQAPKDLVLAAAISIGVPAETPGPREASTSGKLAAPEYFLKPNFFKGGRLQPSGSTKAEIALLRFARNNHKLSFSAS